MSRVRSTLSLERTAEIVRLIADGNSLADIGRHFSVSRERVRQIAMQEKIAGRWDGKVNIKITRGSLPEEVVREVCRLHLEEKRTLSEICVALNCSPTRVRSALEMGGVELTPASRILAHRKCSGEKLIEMWRKLKSSRAVGKRLGISTNAVYCRLVKFIPDELAANRHNLLSPIARKATLEQIQDALKTKTMEEVAEMFDYKLTSLYSICQRNRIEIPGHQTIEVLRRRLAEYERLYGPLPEKCAK